MYCYIVHADALSDDNLITFMLLSCYSCNTQGYPAITIIIFTVRKRKMIVMVIKRAEIIHLSRPLQQLWSGCQGSERGRSSDKKTAVSVRQYNVQLALW